ncbi:uncharacterized protein V1518DRAFT_438705 [Limtongia smithiae]|uniref:uncharacterized protein n=1 Tax=Limtongia smithiae TaxID=1125753 RepID=UPI0034CEF52D
MLSSILFVGFSRFKELFPPQETFIETSVADQSGKVFLVTGGSSGIGLELSRILFYRGGRVIVAGRSKKAYEEAVEYITSTPVRGFETSKLRGALEFLYIDLGDLTSIKPAADELLSTVPRLDVAWYNAGVMMPPYGSKTKQGFELQWGTNVLGHFLLNKYISSLQIATAATAPKGSVRTIWVSSIAHHVGPEPAGINFSDINYENDPHAGKWTIYGQSKTGDIALAYEYAQQVADKGVASWTLHPGNLRSNLTRHLDWFSRQFTYLMFAPTRYGALTELYAGLSPEPVMTGLSFKYIAPWGRIGALNDSVDNALKHENMGKDVWDLCEKQVAPYI